MRQRGNLLIRKPDRNDGSYFSRSCFEVAYGLSISIVLVSHVGQGI